MKLSIIVPVFNTEKYIEKCISSLLNQDINDYEIIVVNDGTKDRSIDIIRQKFQDPRIIIVEQENGGLSKARNFGLRQSHGEYIYFVDSDDYISENCLGSILKNIDDDYDLLYFNGYYRHKGEQEEFISNNNNTLSGKTLSMKNPFVTAWLYIYKKSFLVDNSYFFHEGIYHEDLLFTPTVLYKSNRVKPIGQSIYHVNVNPNSITRSPLYYEKRCHDLMYVIDEMLHFAGAMPLPDKNVWGGIWVSAAVNSLMYVSKKYSIAIDVKHYIKRNPAIVAYLTKSPSIFTKLLAIIAKYSHINLYSLYSMFFYWRYSVIQRFLPK